MTKKGYIVLKAILNKFDSKYIYEIVVSRDKNVQNDYFEEILDLCITYNLSYVMRSPEYRIKTNYSIAISWRWIINIHNSSLIVLHDSLLPKYRGFSPLVNMLINNENEIGVTALFASEDYDKGEIILQQSEKVQYPIKISDAIDKISSIYVSIVLNIISKIIIGEKLESLKQNEHQATYSLWRDDEDYMIDWNSNADEIKRFIDSVGYPYLGAKTFINNRSVRIHDCKVIEDLKIENRDPGKIININNGLPEVVCGTGIIRILDMKNEDRESLIPYKKFRTRFKGY